jgi:hypothetical protein
MPMAMSNATARNITESSTVGSSTLRVRATGMPCWVSFVIR